MLGAEKLAIIALHTTIALTFASREGASLALIIDKIGTLLQVSTGIKKLYIIFKNEVTILDNRKFIS